MSSYCNWNSKSILDHQMRRGPKTSQSTDDFSKTTASIKCIRQSINIYSSCFTDPAGPQVAADRMKQHLHMVFAGDNLPHHRPNAPLPATGPHPKESHPKKRQKWSYIPSAWRVAQVIPVYKKGESSLPSNYRPISLTSVLRKVMEICLTDSIHSASPLLDIAQGGFRPQRSALDQALCLHELVQHHSRAGGLHSHDLFIQQLVFLQGSILSPHLYSLYIKSPPSYLRSLNLSSSTNSSSSLSPFTFSSSSSSVDFTSSSIEICRSFLPKSNNIPINLAIVGIQQNVSRFISLATPNFQLYGQPIKVETSFTYLGGPFSSNLQINLNLLIPRNTSSAITAMKILKSIGCNPTGLPR
ncbi:hypothetical protein INT45_000919 [Circinella minor]|uniref:Reverse transcriptase domain-containing protein n=1 Tax=Circinella minor TaxID=1195481 RepID=A0A8H7VL48_9FUNG|nr:hypothetical protein INT45_000919 [Circinella minor]